MEVFEQTNAANLADFCVEIYAAGNLLDRIRLLTLQCVALPPMYAIVNRDPIECCD